VRSHAWYNLAPVSYDRERGVLRTHVAAPHPDPLPAGGEAHELTFRVRGGKLEARSEGLDPSRLRAIARRVFSLDLDFADASRSFAAEPTLAAALQGRGARMLRGPTVFEDAVKMLFTTNCSWAATRGMVTRLIELAGADGRAFPTPESVARLSVATIGKRVRCGYRAQALSDFAKRVASGKLDLSRWEGGALSSEDLRAAIVSERGFGPYAAEGLIRILGRHDFYALDSWTRQEYRRRYPGPARATDRSIARRYARFRKHRGLAFWLEMTDDWHE